MTRRDYFPLEGFVEDYLREIRARRSRATYEKYYYQLRKFLRFCDQEHVHRPQDLTRKTWLDYLSYLRESRGKPWTIHTGAKTVKGFLKWLYDEGYLKEPPFRPRDIPSQPKPEPAPMSVEEVQQLLDVLKSRPGWIGKRDYALVVTLLSTGLRRSELVQMTVGMVHSGVVLVRQKGNRRLQTYLDEETLRVVRQYLRALYRETGYQPHEEDRLWRDVSLQPLTPHAVDQIFRRIRQRLPFRVYPHRLRATSITWRLELGASTELVRAVVGHEHPQAIEHYARFSERDQRRLTLETNPLKRVRLH